MLVHWKSYNQGFVLSDGRFHIIFVFGNSEKNYKRLLEGKQS